MKEEERRIIDFSFLRKRGGGAGRKEGKKNRKEGKKEMMEFEEKINYCEHGW